MMLSSGNPAVFTKVVEHTDESVSFTILLPESLITLTL